MTEISIAWNIALNLLFVSKSNRSPVLAQEDEDWQEIRIELGGERRYTSCDGA